MPCAAVVLLLCIAGGSGTPARQSSGDAQASGAPDPGWELLVTSAGQEVPRTCFRAPELPSWAQGAFFVSGPARFEVGGYSFKSLFDGLGRANRFELLERQVCYTSAWLQTGNFREAEARGAPARGILFEDTVPPQPSCPVAQPMCDLQGPNDNNWVNMIEVGGEGLLLSDTFRMVRMDVETLSCMGIKPWMDDNPADSSGQPNWTSPLHEPIAASAHPMKRPGTQTWVDVIVQAPLFPQVEHSLIGLYTFEGTTAALQPRSMIASLKADANQYFHSFGVTRNYIVLPFNLLMKMPPLVGTPVLLGSFQPSWRGIHVVDFSGAVQVFDTEHFFHTHMLNAFENGTGITMDVGMYPENPFAMGPALDIDLFRNKAARDSARNRAFVRRLHLHLLGPLQGKTTYEDFAVPGRSVDFFKINMARSGLAYCVYYAIEWWHDGARYASMAVLKHDLCRGVRTYWKRAHTYPGEPFFISAGSEIEDDGAVVFHALDGQRGHSIFVVLDAGTFAERVVVDLPVHIPFTAHGQFIPSRSAATSLVI